MNDPRTPRTFAPHVYERLMNGYPLTRADVMSIGLSHGLGYYRAHEIVGAMVDEGILQRRINEYRLAPRYQARAKRTQQ
jgi:hypothetical protein